ncbi:hypothetical protein B0A52_02780 [Exophiala mesophila]|uniref:RhoGAP-domain-containing protein n=1 Tax=Exophiala mesophila TaxID=212818 RepID=A0A438NDV9_EXOME|nr:hypothetical protein B0A52_02780 [Exophiala mesophila]
MLHQATEAAAPRSHSTRLPQTTVHVSNASPTPHAHPSPPATRLPARPVINDSLIPRDYLSSLTASRSPGSSKTSFNQDNSFLEDSTTDEADDHHDQSILQSEAGLTSATNTRPVVTSSPRPSPSPEILRNTPKDASVQDRRSADQPSSLLVDSPTSYTSSATVSPPPNNMPRTSSIDSAISNMSNTPGPQRPPGDAKEPTKDEVRNLINTAGSPENLIQHLLRDKNHSAAQNAQLWKLVDKQRALLLGLNKDLERLTKERDRYRKRVKDLQSQPPPVPANRIRAEVDQENNSPQSDNDAASITSIDALTGREGATRTGPITPGRVPNLHLHGSPLDAAMVPHPLHLQHPPKIDVVSTQLPPPSFALSEPSPLQEKPPKSFQASRKAPPRPLNLSQPKDDRSAAKQSIANGAVISDEEADDRDPVRRGRRKTREEDDRDRETLALKEQEARSRSKRETKTGADPGVTEPAAAAPRPSHDLVDLPSSKAMNQLSPPSTASHSSLGQSPNPLRSPGLPLSPRPLGQALLGASLPMSPRNLASGSFPLSPRAPKQPLPDPTTPGQQAPAPGAEKKGPSPLSKVNSASTTASDQPTVPDPPLSPRDAPPVNRGLVSPTWPDLLLPPNALPSIQIKVASSRLRPSRNSILGLKAQDESSVFSLSVFERATASELWRVEKIPATFPVLDQTLRSRCSDLPKLPDRRLFSGHSPAVVDARRLAIDHYFEELLDTPMDEQAAVTVCRYLSTDVMESQHSRPPPASEDTHSKPIQSARKDVIPTKSGYLTKKGKNFGGWKSRYFVLDSPELRYFEAPGGAHLGTIKLLNARIGRQTQSDPAPRSEAENENQYRHAFLILEPKRRDNNSHLRHVLCAESDEERDEWVETLLHYIDERPSEPKAPHSAGPQNTHGKDVKNPRSAATESGHDESERKGAGSPSFGHANSDTPSPSTASTNVAEASSAESGYPIKSNISAPMNGVKISDTSLWGNRSAGTGSSKEREQKKRHLFNHFRKASSEQLASNHQAQAPVAQPKRLDYQARRGGHVRPVFGMQLHEAVEYYSPLDVEVYLPAVVYRCIEYLRAKKAANEEGLFRLSGSNIVIRELKDRFNVEGDVDLLADDEQDYDVHAVASLFKMYLRELPSTILTRELHLEFLKVLEMGDKSQKVMAFNTLVHQLPVCNFMLLRSLSQYLLEVVQNSDRNRMSVKNVGIVFSPTLNIPAPVFAIFLTEFEAIFDKPAERETTSVDMQRENGTLTPEDIRSPRRQMFSDLPTPSHNQSSFANNASVSVTGAHNHASNQDHREANKDLGFSPLQPSYETRSYVSIPQEISLQPRHPPPHPPPPPPQSSDYEKSTLLMTPENAASVKAKRRESSMLFL